MSEPPRRFVEPGTSGHWLSRLNSDRDNLIKAWIAAILWLIVIAIESTALLSSHNTSRILFPLLHYLFGMDWVRFEYWHFYIRKGGHVVGYGILSVLLFRAWRATLPSMLDVKWTMRWASIAILGTAFVASLDEWHQSFIPSRTGRWQDVVLDTTAGIAAQILIFLWCRRLGKGAAHSRAVRS
jgi:VanZ family protein